VADDDLWTFRRDWRIGGEEVVRLYDDDLGQLVISTENDDNWVPVVLDRDAAVTLVSALSRWLDEHPSELRERAAEFDRQAIAGMRERATREGHTSL